MLNPFDIGANAANEETAKQIEEIEYIVKVHKELHGTNIQFYAIINDIKRREMFKNLEVEDIEYILNLIVSPADINKDVR